MAEAVREMFSRIAPRYDLANAVLSFGLHTRWRRRAVEMAQTPPGGSVLDVATGTGDLAFLFQRAVGPTGRVVGIDFSQPMLEQARAKAGHRNLRVEFRAGDALNLDFPNGAFDVASIGFGIRNVDDPVRCLGEMARVVRPGGRVVVLEFGQPGGLGRRPYRWYGRFVIPRVGRVLTGDRAAYEYLPRTTAAFPYGSAFVDLMRQNGRLEGFAAEPLTGGVAYVYVGRVKAPTGAGSPH